LGVNGRFVYHESAFYDTQTVLCIFYDTQNTEIIVACAENNNTRMTEIY